MSAGDFDLLWIPLNAQGTVVSCEELLRELATRTKYTMTALSMRVSTVLAALRRN